MLFRSFDEAREQVIDRIQQVRGVSEELYVALLKRRADINVTWAAAGYLNGVYADLRAIKLAVDDRRIELPAAARLLPNSNLIVPAVPMLEAMGASKRLGRPGRKMNRVEGIRA